MTTTAKPKNYTASPAHAKRAKVGDRLGQMTYDADPAAPRYVSHAYYEVVKVHDDGALTVKSIHGSGRKTLKPDTDRTGRRLAWYYLERQPYESNVYLYIENARDRRLQAEADAEYDRERKAEERRKQAQVRRNRDAYRKLTAFAEEHGHLLRGMGGSPKLTRKGEGIGNPQDHRSLADIVPTWSDKTDLTDITIEVPVQLLLDIIAKKG